MFVLVWIDHLLHDTSCTVSSHLTHTYSAMPETLDIRNDAAATAPPEPTFVSIV